MHILIGAIFAIGMFCWWLSGNWYARAVVFTGGGLLAFAMGALKEDPVAFGCGLFFWWFVADLPNRLRVRSRAQRVTPRDPGTAAY